MGTGKKKIQIEKITKETSRMVTFSKRRKGLFKKAGELESITGSRVAAVVFSPTGRPYTCGNVSSAIERHFSSFSEPSSSGLNSHHSNSDEVSGSSSGSRSSPPPRNSLRDWLEDINVEQCQNLNQLLMLKEQLKGTREKLVSKDSECFQALFMRGRLNKISGVKLNFNKSNSV